MNENVPLSQIALKFSKKVKSSGFKNPEEKNIISSAVIYLFIISIKKYYSCITIAFYICSKDGITDMPYTLHAHKMTLYFQERLYNRTDKSC